MTRARGVDAPRDPAGAARLLGQGRRTLASAALEDVDADSGYGLAYQAALKGALALLRAHGRRVSAASGGHVVVLAEVERLLPGQVDAVRRIDRMRRSRNQLVCDGEEVGDAERRQAVRDAGVLLDLVATDMQDTDG